MSRRPWSLALVAGLVVLLGAAFVVAGPARSSLLGLVGDCQLRPFNAQCPGMNLSGANLHGHNLSLTNLMLTNLNQADLTGANLSWANLREANLTGANLNLAFFCKTTMPDGSVRTYPGRVC